MSPLPRTGWVKPPCCCWRQPCPRAPQFSACLPCLALPCLSRDSGSGVSRGPGGRPLPPGSYNLTPWRGNAPALSVAAPGRLGTNSAPSPHGCGNGVGAGGQGSARPVVCLGVALRDHIHQPPPAFAIPFFVARSTCQIACILSRKAASSASHVNR